MAELQKSSTFSCPGCGGRPVWNPKGMNMTCPFCNTETAIPLDRSKPEVYDILQAPKAEEMDWGDEKRVVRCESCGAETVLGPGESATICAFCGSPRILDDQSSAGIAPESVIPFSVSKDDAVSAFRTWLRKKKFAPGKAKKMAALGQITGVYLPYWAYNSDTSSRYTGEAGYHYEVEETVTVERDGKQVEEKRMVQKTRWEPTSGFVSNHFEEILIPGSQRLPDYLLRRVQPYKLEELCRYQAGFLSGFSAEKPAVNVNGGWESAQKVIEEKMESLATSDILTRADEARVNSVNSQHRQVRYKLSLLPMYLSSFTFKDKPYHVLVNGQTGKVGGEAPTSPMRVIVTIACVIAVIAAILFFARQGRADLLVP